MNNKKKTSKHQILYKDSVSQTVVALAQLGLTTAAIAQRTGLTECQVQYRLSKAQAYDGEHYTRLRTAWRHGTADVFDVVQKDIVGVLCAEVRRKLTPKIEHDSGS